MFLVFEGIDGCGRATQLHLIADYLRGRGHQVVTTQEFGDCDIAEQLRQMFLSSTPVLLPETQLFLMEAARIQHCHDVILPALASGKIVLCDRFVSSTRVYQGYRSEIRLDEIRRLETTFVPIFPDFTIYLRISSEEAARRLNLRYHRTQEHPTSLDPVKIETCRQLFQYYELLSYEAELNIINIDASDTALEVFQRIKASGILTSLF